MAVTFFRLVIGGVFLVSFVGKVRNIKAFEETISQFKLFRGPLNRYAAFAFLGSEASVAGSMIAGKAWLSVGFLLAAFLLFVFSIALASVIVRKIDTPCNCFGPAKKVVSGFDLVRNLGLILCAGTGWILSRADDYSLSSVGLPDVITAGFAALVVILLFLNLGEIIQTLQKT